MDHTTPNLPSADFHRTIALWGALGFDVAYRSADWLILERGLVPSLSPSNSLLRLSIR